MSHRQHHPLTTWLAGKLSVSLWAAGHSYTRKSFPYKQPCSSVNACSACVQPASPAQHHSTLGKKRLVFFKKKCAISRAGNMFLQPRVARGFIELWKLFRSDFFLFWGLCDGRFHGFCSSTHTTHGGDPRWLKNVIVFFVLHEMFCISGSHRIS